ncbi:DUF7563 family protein [Halopiger aswanensis]|uniref:Small CPxCG-related zinc finger protein n=1 Tax=Halopiger aswanensis TaxID=148449 RepID=A0A419WGZ7_9EURY|nr:hypothetical protein ATJ93_1590 [Halopiger aswanensis]
MARNHHCQHCNAVISSDFVRVFGQNGKAFACPDCETWEAIYRGAATSEHASKTPMSSAKPTDADTSTARVTLDDLQDNRPQSLQDDGTSSTIHRDCAFEQLAYE